MRVKFLLALASVVLTLCALELVLARFFPQRTMDRVVSIRAPIFQSSEQFPFELIPGAVSREAEHEGEFDVAVTINSQGYRQDEIDTHKDPATTRVVAIGDSFTFGAGVENEEAWPRALERELRKRQSRPVEVINAGVAGRWVDEYFVELQHRTLALDPDIVLIGLFVGNDIDGKDARSHEWSEVDAQGLPVKIVIPGHRVEHGHRLENHLRTRWHLPIVRSSHVAQLFYDGGKAIVQRIKPAPLTEETMYAPVYEPETERALTQTEKLLAAMADLCRARGVEMLVVLIPTREQVSPEIAGGSRTRDWEKPQRLLTEFLGRAGIPYLDLLPIQRAAVAEGPLYFTYDGHWNARGHAVAAEAVAARLAGDIGAHVGAQVAAAGESAAAPSSATGESAAAPSSAHAAPPAHPTVPSAPNGP